MKEKICIVCGKKAEIGNFCKKCFLKRAELFRVKNFSIMICDCGAYFDKKWKKSNLKLEDLVKKIILDRIESKNEIVEKSVDLKKVGNRFFATVKCKGKIRGIEKIEKKSVVVKFEKRKCEACSRLAGGYYEAVVQVRGNKKEEIMKKLNLKGIVEIKKIKNGYDIKLLSKSEAKKLLRKFKKDFNITISKKLVTQKKDKKIYRDYYCVR